MKDKIINSIAIIIIVFLLFVLAASFARAESLTFSWTANLPPTDGYRLYMDSSNNMIQDSIPIEQETITVLQDLEGSCHNFWLRAYLGNEESLNSDIAIACPVDVDPPPYIRPVNVGGFTVTINVEPNG